MKPPCLFERDQPSQNVLCPTVRGDGKTVNLGFCLKMLPWFFIHVLTFQCAVVWQMAHDHGGAKRVSSRTLVVLFSEVSNHSCINCLNRSTSSSGASGHRGLGWLDWLPPQPLISSNCIISRPSWTTQLSWWTQWPGTISLTRSCWKCTRWSWASGEISATSSFPSVPCSMPALALGHSAVWCLPSLVFSWSGRSTSVLSRSIRV